jgi:hypothetical protein
VAEAHQGKFVKEQTHNRGQKLMQEHGRRTSITFKPLPLEIPSLLGEYISSHVAYMVFDIESRSLLIFRYLERLPLLSI